MALSVARLLPGQGLDLSYLDDRALDGNPMRGADNVRVVDGEWWTREGTKALRGVAGGGMPVHFASLDLMYGNTATRRHFLIGRQAVIEVAVEAGTYACSVPYTASWTGTVDFSNGSVSVNSVTTTTGNPDHVDLLYGYDSDGVQVVYTVASYSAGTPKFTLRNQYRGNTATTVAVSGFASPTRAVSTSLADLGRVSYCIFRQRTAYASGDVWGGAGAATAPLYMDKSPALAAGGLYLVWAPGRWVSGGTNGPCLIRLDQTETIKGEFMRKTQASFTSATAFSNGDAPKQVTTHRDRLLVVRADENNSNDDRTVWYSAPGDMMRWHTGTAGGSPAATHNNIKLTEGQDPITALMPLGPSLIVHRTHSQTSLTPTGSASFPPGPYTIEHNEQGIGCLSQSALVNIRGAHIFLSQYGPMQFDGQRCSPLNPALTRVVSQLSGTAEWVNDTNTLSGLLAVYHAPRQEIWFRFSPTAVADPWEGAITSRSRFLVYSIETSNMSIVSTTDAETIGVFRRQTSGAEFVVGTLNDFNRYPLVQFTQTSAAYDTANPSNLVTVFDATKVKFPAYVETKWFNFGTETEKEIVKLELELRALSTSSSYQNEVVTDLDTSAFKYMLEIHTDLDLTKFAVQQVVTVTPSDLTGLSAYAEGRRMLPRVIVVPKVRVQGNLFKFRIRNFGTGISVSQPFRLSQIQVFYEDREATRREKRP